MSDDLPDADPVVDIVLTDAAFDDLLLRLDDPPQVNAKMVELLRRTRGTVEHR